jgi:phage/plasmid-like protein (TIGR03299 family)
MVHEVERNKENEPMHASAEHVHPWHGLTNVVGIKNLDEAMAKAGLIGWAVEKWPIFTKDPVERDGKFIHCKNQWNLVRTMDGKVLSSKTVTDDYEVIQLEQVFDVLRPFVEKGELQFECAGSLRHGQRPFILMRFCDTYDAENGVPITDFEDDRVVPYLLCNTGFSGNDACYFDLTEEQVVCMNTLRAAEGRMLHPIYITHTKNADERMLKAAEALVMVREQWNKNIKLYKKMAAFKVGQPEVLSATRNLLDIPDEKETALLPKQTLRRINRLEHLFRNGPGRRGETMWDWFSAVTHYVTHDSIVRGENTRLESAWWGTGLRFETKARNIADKMMAVQAN